MNEQERSMRERGVYFRRGDYAGFWRRLLVDFVDYGVALVAFNILAIPMDHLAPDASILKPFLLLLVGSVLWLGYFVFLKRSDLGTVGYRLASVRLTNLQGDRPSLIAVALRGTFLFLGPLNNLLDLAWLGGDDQRQALRDKFAQTYVVRRDAKPLGGAPVMHMTYTLAGGIFLFREVNSPANPRPRPSGAG